MTARRYDLGATDLSQYASLTPEEREAWLNPEPHSYHSLHVERMGADTLRWRDSRTAHFYIGSANDLRDFTYDLQLRRLDPKYRDHASTLRILSQAEVDDLLGDL